MALEFYLECQRAGNCVDIVPPELTHIRIAFSICVLTFQDTIQLDVVGLRYSEVTWVGELAPYTLRLTVKQARIFPKLRMRFQCSAREFGAAFESSHDNERLTEDEFEAYLVDPYDVKNLSLSADASEGAVGVDESQSGTDEAFAQVTRYPRLLRVPTNGKGGVSLVFKAASAETGGNGDSMPHSGMRDPSLISTGCGHMSAAAVNATYVL